jgi:hypothetical protein
MVAFPLECLQKKVKQCGSMKEFNIDIVKVIGDFLELGHVENIVAMFKQDTGLYDHTGSLLRDERFTVRLGTAVLFEELALIRPDEISLAIPSLLPPSRGAKSFTEGRSGNHSRHNQHC